MVTTEQGTPEPEIGNVEGAVRTVFAGDSHGAVRRIILYILVVTMIALTDSSPAPIVPLLLLAVSDQYA